MSTQFEIDCALMAGASYISTRPDINKFPTPVGWVDVTNSHFNDSSTGFEAVAFQSQCSNDIVISFAGTDPTSISDLWTDGKLALGFTSTQLLQAAEYYITVKSANSDAKITFTGHSLGGGLAALMGVFFNQTAVTFDQAPFLASATQSVATDVLNDLLAKFPPATNLQIMNLLAPLTGFINHIDPLTDSLLARTANVTDTNVQGEFLSSSFDPFNRIGTQTDIPNNTSGVSGTDLHAQSLLTAFLQSDQSGTANAAGQKQSLSQVTFKLTDLLGMIFDTNLFARDTKKDQPNLLEHLVRHEAGVRDPVTGVTTVAADAMVTRFTSDLWKLAQDGGLTMRESATYANYNNISKALTAFAMQFYYEDTANATNVGKQLFTDLGAGSPSTGSGQANGIRFDMHDVSKDVAAAMDANAQVDLTKAKGYQYFQAYLDTTSLLSPAERTLIKSILPQLRDWYVQAGSSGMNATDTLNRGAFMLGGTGADTLTGGTATDLLVGNAGADTLQGGGGNDTLLGGSGNDTYKYNAGDGLDTILDSDGQGGIMVDGTILAGGDQYGDARVHRDAKGHLYVDVGSPGSSVNGMVIDGNIFVQNWQARNLGINMTGAVADTNPATTHDITGDPITYWATLNGSTGPGSNWKIFKTYPRASDGSYRVDYYLVDADGNPAEPGGAALADTLYNTAQNDHITGGAGDDTVRAGALEGGADLIEGGAGRDYLEAGSGNDVVTGGTEADVLIGGSGNDRLYADAQVDAATAIALGNAQTGSGLQGDFLSGGSGDDTLAGGSGNDVLAGGGGKDLLVGGAGNDMLLGDSDLNPVNLNWSLSGLTFNGVTGNQNPADGSDDVIYGGAGNDTIRGRKGNDVIFGEGDNDEITGGAGNDIILGGAGNDILSGDYDSLSPGYGDDYLDGGAGDDRIWGDEGNDILIGGKDNDRLEGGSGQDTYIYNVGDGIDNIYDNLGERNILRFGAGINSNNIKLHLGSLMLDLGNGDAIHIQNFNNNDVFNSSSIGGFEFADGSTLTTAELLARGFDIDGTAGNDNLIGTNTTDRINGYGGNDFLMGLAGNDTLDGGAGNDYMMGGSGSDTYLFELGGGQDKIEDYTTYNNSTPPFNNDTDTIRFGAGIAHADILFSRSGNNLVLGINGTTDQLTILNWEQPSGSGVEYRIERVEFADGTAWDAAYLQERISGMTIVGTSGNDNLTGSNWLGANDTLLGLDGNDTLTGNAGNNILDGGAGNDILRGGSAGDLYLFGLGGGQDTLYDYDATQGNIDTLRFGAGIAPADITFARSGNDLVLGINGTIDQITIQNWGSGNASRIERVEFAPSAGSGQAGTVWDAGYLQAQVLVTHPVGTNGNDVLAVWDGESAVVLQGVGGNDTLIGGTGNDILDGGIGNDTLYGGIGNDVYQFSLGGGQDVIFDYDAQQGNADTLRFGAGIAPADITFTRRGSNLVIGINGTTDQLTIQNWGVGNDYRFERVEFADGTVWDAAYLQAKAPIFSIDGTSGNDVLYGDWGNNILNGGAGNDTLNGGAGNDVYLFNLGGGQDTIWDYDTTPGNVDTIRFGAGILPADITFARSGGDLVLGINGTADQLRVGYWGYYNASCIERVEFANGTVWDAAYLQTQVSSLHIVGTSGNDSLSNNWVGAGTTLLGMDGNDGLAGGDSNDILDGGAGIDTLQGGAGNDTYLFGLGGGQDTIYGWNNQQNNIDTVRFGAGILPADITFARSGNDLVLGINGTTDQLTLAYWGASSAFQNMRIEFAPTTSSGQAGTVWDAAYLRTQVPSLSIVGTSGNDYLGSSWEGSNDALQGLSGADTLVGSSGNNTLDGGIGNDILMGGTGNDVYLFDQGGEQDTINDYDSTPGNIDTVRFGAGIAPADVSFRRSGSDLVLGVNGTTDQVTIQGWGTDNANHIERVEFADGTAWDAAYLKAQVLIAHPVGTNGNDVLSAWTGVVDTLDGGAGNDFLFGNAGSQVYLFGLGGGQDTIDDGFYYTASEAGAIDTVRFGTGIAPADISFSRSGSDLVFGINGTTDQLTIRSWGNGSAYRIERVEFADGTVWDTAYLQAHIPGLSIAGTVYSDYLSSVWVGANDTLLGGLGADSYFINEVATGVVENVGEGIDTVYANVDYALLANVENLYLDGAAQIGIGNELDNRIETQNSAIAYHLEGRGGNDFLSGYHNNDVLDGGTGNDTLIGWSGNDWLDGGTGADTMIGGAGNDTYIVDDAGDLVYENIGAGIDTVQTALTYVLPSNVENLTLTGNSEINGTGNIFSNILVGNVASNILQGGRGNDTLAGNTGNDTLDGGIGDDTYNFWMGDGQDTITDHDATAGNVDVLSLKDALAANVTLAASGNDLVVNVGSAGDSITIKNWLLTGDTSYRVENIAFADGTVWDAATITAMVNPVPVNHAPAAAAIAAQNATQGQAFSFSAATVFSDPDAGDVLTLSASLANGSPLPSWLTFDAATQTFSGIPGNADVGSLNLLVTATDAGGLSAGSAFAMNVANVNDAPVANADMGAATEDGGAVQMSATTLLSNDTDPDYIHGDTFNIVGVSQATSGAAVSLLPSTSSGQAGGVRYDAGSLFQSLAAGQTTTDTFSYTIADAAGVTSTADVTMTITGVNDAPVTTADTAVAQEDITFAASGNVLANDMDVDQGTLLGVANAGVFAGSYGQLTLAADGSYSYALDNASLSVQSLAAGQIVTETFGYQATDGIVTTPSTLTVNITGTNDAPIVATPIAGQQTNEDAPFSFTVPANTFTDIDNGDTLSYSATLADGTALPSWLTFDAATQAFSGIPTNWDVGNLNVLVTATDTGGLSATSNFALNVANVNDAPTVSMALADHAALQGAAFSFTVPVGTFGDVDFIHGPSTSSGQALTYGATLADGTALPGWLSFDAATQTFSGIPTNWDVGNLNVLVTATDTGGLSATSNFALNVVNVNDAPTANVDAGVATEDGGAVLLDAAALLANDTDPDFVHGDALNIVGVSQAASGAAVSLLPSPFGTSGSGQAGNVQYDPSTSSGQVNGSLFQSLAQGQTATDTFSYTVSDMAGATSTATVTMTITGVNDGPVTVNDTAAAQEDASLTATGNVLANDSDVDQGTVLSVANAGTLQGNYGSLVLNADGSYSYALGNASLAVQSLAAGQTVTESFGYQATDGIAITSATLTVSITGTNDAPVTVADVAAVREDLNITATGNVLANDSDVDRGTVLSVANAGLFAGNYGQLTLATDGSYSYALNNASPGVQSLAAGQVVTETFAYAATDGLIATPSTLTVTITGTNDAPVTVADAAAVQEDLSIAATGNVLINDSDVDQGAALSVLNAGVFAGNYGQLTLATDGNYTYALDNPSTGSGQARATVQSLAAGQIVTETFAYEATDGTVATPSALTVSITGTNDAPVAAADAAYVREDLNITATGNVLANDTDVDQGTVLSVADAGVRAGSYGSLNLATDGSYTYTPDNASMSVQSLGRDAQVAEHFGYTATDGMVGNSAVLDVFLNGTNDAPILVAPLADQNFTFHKHFSWQMPEGSFIDIDQGDTLTYGATLADGSALPDWLNFDAATRTFSGETPKKVGFVDVRVTATDSVAATGSTAGSLSASDVFRISVSHGNEGVGNGEDAPPPGHDHNTNDGAGTSPGHPGSPFDTSGGGNDHPSASAKHPQEQDRQDRSSDAKTHKDDTRQQDSEDTEDSGSHRTDELIRTWFEEESASEQYSSFGALDRHGAWGGQIDRQVNRNVARGISGDVSQEWERMNARLKKHLEQSGGDEGLFAESGTGSRSFGLFGSGGQQGIAQLGMGGGQQLKSLAGLKEGLERLGG